MNIVVLSGGLSTERDVSISTGTKVCRALRELGHKAILLDVYFGYENTGKDIDNIFSSGENQVNEWSNINELVPDISRIKSLRKDKDNSYIGKNVIQICKRADIVFMALHGENGENGKLQATFDLMGIKYTGTGYLGSAIAMNKQLTKKVFENTHIKTPKYRVINIKDIWKYNLSDIALPCVIKPCSGGSSIGVSIAHTLEELENAITTAANFEDDIILEEYIKGRELSVGVLGNRSLPIIEIVPKQGFYDYVNKYQPDFAQEICPAPLDDFLTRKIQSLAIDIHHILGLEIYSRIDFLLDKDNQVFCLEANTLPGMTPTSLLPQEAAAIGISYNELCESIMKESLERYKKSEKEVKDKKNQEIVLGNIIKKITVKEIVDACDGLFYGNETDLDKVLTGITIDSRKVKEDFLYIPIKGEHFDGHDFIKDSYHQKAMCCLTEKPLNDATFPYILVKSSKQALKDIAQYYRTLFQVKVIAVTGSVGKTTTKELISTVLSQKYNVLKTQGNLNNEIGLPLTIFNLRDEHDFIVLEMGMNHFGEISALSKIAKPDVAVITNIGVAHIENLGSREGILKAKCEIFDFMSKGAEIILNGDDDMLSQVKNNNFNISFFGLAHENQVYADEIVNLGLNGINCNVHIEDEVINVHIPSPGKHMILNTLIAVKLGKMFMLSNYDIISGIKDYVPVGNRMNVLKLDYITIINDVYNANPASMCAGIDVLEYSLGRKVCILGDMYELGEHAQKFHYEVGEYAALKGIDLMISLGELAKHISLGTIENSMKSTVISFMNRDVLLKDLKNLIRKGDTILIKASRGMHLEEIVEYLKQLQFE